MGGGVQLYFQMAMEKVKEKKIVAAVVVVVAAVVAAVVVALTWGKALKMVMTMMTMEMEK